MKIQIRNWRVWPQVTEARLENIFASLKAARVELFVKELGLGPEHRILDFGSEDGSYLSRYYP